MEHRILRLLDPAVANMRAGTSTLQGMVKTDDGYMFAYCTGVPTASAVGFAPGCICRRSNGASGTFTYINEGTKAAATWVAAPSLSATTTTIASGKTLAVTTADKLTVGGVIVPQFVSITHKLNPANTSGEFFFVADRAYTLISISEIHNVVAGQACVALIRKCTSAGTALADATAGATCVEFVTAGIDLTATAAVTQTATLAVTTIAAGDKLAVKMGNGTSMVGGHITLKLQCA